MKNFIGQKKRACPNRTAKRCGRGFTLVETLVAISIFTFSILGLISVLSQGVVDTGYAKKKMTATYLAEEGIEYIRNMRDTYVLYSGDSEAGWNTFKSRLTAGFCTNTNGCYFDDRNISFSDTSQPMNDLSFAACISSTCPNAELRYNAATWKYGYVSGSASGFFRKINVAFIGSNEVKVTSTVYWAQGSGTYNAAFSESLFNWIE